MAQEEYLPKPIVVHAMKFTGGRENAWELMDWVRKEKYQANWYNTGTSQNVIIDRGEDYIVVNLGDYLVRNWEGNFEHLLPVEFHKRYEPKALSEPVDASNEK
jgi:hypothetical protein